jgi:hypothetical protein
VITSSRRWLFTTWHTYRWILVNVAEFDRRHLHGTLRWLFGPREKRVVRPPRRIVGVLFWAIWLPMVTIGYFSDTAWERRHLTGLTEFTGDLLYALLALSGLAAVLLVAVLIRKRRARPAKPVPVRSYLRVEMSDGSVRDRPIPVDDGTRITITSGRQHESDQAYPSEVRFS